MMAKIWNQLYYPSITEWFNSIYMRNKMWLLVGDSFISLDWKGDRETSTGKSKLQSSM